MEKLNRNFYNRPSTIVAKELLGKYLFRNSPEGLTGGKIVETEAYMGVNDPACHAYGGKITERNKILYGPPGYVYIYIIYGMYYCLNIVTERKGIPNAVFIRALEPKEGIDIMMRRRRKNNLIELTNGPSKLCHALRIRKELYGEDICGDLIYITSGEEIDESLIVSGPRVNVDYAGDARYWPWRFYIKGNKFVSST